MADANGGTPFGRDSTTTQTPPPATQAPGSASESVTRQAAAAPTTALPAAPAAAATVSADDGLGKRPRDARLIHAVLANQGVTAYQERVPLQLLDFCYRYTSATVADALHLASDLAQNVTGTGKIAQSDGNSVSMNALKLSVASRTHYQLNPTLPKEYLVELAAEKNKTAMPPVGKDWGTRLPPERYTLTGVSYGIRDDWESEGEEDVDEVQALQPDAVMGEADDDEDGEEVEGGRMEDLYGEDNLGDEDMDTKDG